MVSSAAEMDKGSGRYLRKYKGIYISNITNYDIVIFRNYPNEVNALSVSYVAHADVFILLVFCDHKSKPKNI